MSDTEDSAQGAGIEALPLRDRLNLETARVEWGELQRHFAHGTVIVVSGSQDLIDIGASFVEDDRQRIENLMGESQVRRAETSDATDWNERNASFWAVVVAPWVLVQEIST